jgi:hypothetical protein
LILLDATAFSLLVNPDARPPNDPATSQPVDRVKERFQSHCQPNVHHQLTRGRYLARMAKSKTPRDPFSLVRFLA